MATKLVSVVTGGSNSHQTSSAEINGIATDFISEGVVGAISATSGVAPTTGAFAVNQIGTPTMDVRVTNGVAYVTATPTSGSEQTFRVTMDATEDVTIAANATGGTRYDWIYIKLDADKLVNPAVDASDVATLTTSRSTSASTDNGTPPTYGYCIAVVTVANGASSITNANITDSRVRTGANSIVQTANVPVGSIVQVQQTDYSAASTTTSAIPVDDTEPQNTEGAEVMSQTITPKAAGNTLIVEVDLLCSMSAPGEVIVALFQDSTASAVAAKSGYMATATGRMNLTMRYKVTAASTAATTFKVRMGVDPAGTATFNGFSSSRKYGTTVKSSIRVMEVKA